VGKGGARRGGGEEREGASGDGEEREEAESRGKVEREATVGHEEQRRQ
jgi:hypothetical protein